MEKVSSLNDDNLSNILLSCWQTIETVTRENDSNVDDFLVYFEYYKLASNPKTNVIQEFKTIIETSPSISEFITELETFANKLKELYDSKDKKHIFVKIFTMEILYNYNGNNSYNGRL